MNSDHKPYEGYSFGDISKDALEQHRVLADVRQKRRGLRLQRVHFHLPLISRRPPVVRRAPPCNQGDRHG